MAAFSNREVLVGCLEKTHAYAWNRSARPQPCDTRVDVQGGPSSPQSVDAPSPARSPVVWTRRTERWGWAESVQLRGQHGGE